MDPAIARCGVRVLLAPGESRKNYAAEKGGTRIGDHVRYALPFGVLGELMHKLIVRRDVESIFAFRQRPLTELLGRS